ncbi:MAG: penicillin-binding protein activator LpoB [Phycisphaerales bacterium]
MKAMAMTVVACCGLVAAGCNDNYKIKRTNPDQTTDVDYRFNDDDAREVVARAMEDCLKRPWIDRFMAENGGRQPIVYLANVRNKTQDYSANPELFTTKIQEELLNSGRVRVKAERDSRQELRDERLDTKYNDPATIKAVAKEVNADFALTGQIIDNKQRSLDGKKIVNYYEISLELTDVERATKEWIKTVPLKKVATR